MNVAIICTALLGLLLFGLGLHVSLLRAGSRRNIGHDASPVDPLHRAVRAHANTAEYAPFFAVLFLWYATRAAPTWILAVIVLATIARFAIAAGLLLGPPMDRPNPARFLGALFTYICGLVLAAGLLVA
ncbi:MAPEG family protein [Bradyrhizobium sp.]|uniref:MAPEG family protein n=1 Tax=Bradyrhizobium sp. TaxID=376 RepID=UPI004037D9D4